MLEIMRNLYRRRMRTGLTVLGIAVGVLAFTVMGGMAEKINLIIRGSQAYFASRIAVRSLGGAVRLNLLSTDDLRELRHVPGVQWVESHVMLPMDETAGFELAPRFLVGIDLANFMQAQKLSGPDAQLRMHRGDWWAPGQHKVAVLGSAVARKMKLGVGDALDARGEQFRVVGVLEETLTMPDGWAFVPQDDARRLMLDDSQLLKELGITTFATNAYALVNPSDGDAITERISNNLRKGFLLYSPQQLGKAAGQASTLLTSAIMGASVIAIIVGALSVINTMFVAVGERTREIGIKKAIGASRWDILQEFLLESTLMGLLGGLAGVGLGALIIRAVNLYTADQGTPIFILTPRLALWGIGFSALLGAAAGILPAWRAARLNPVDALREF